MQPFDLLIIALAAWRLARFVTKDSGPWRVMERVRARTTLGGMLDCIYCASVWAAALAYTLLLTPAAWLVVIAAGSGGAMLLHRYTGGEHV